MKLDFIINPKTALKIAVPIVMGLAGCVNEGSNSQAKLESMDVDNGYQYEGEYGNYNVEIFRYADDNTIQVHLTGKHALVVPNGITGHDYGVDGTWDKIFIMPEKYSGCNAVVSDGENYYFDPCGAWKSGIDKTPKPTDADVIQAKRLLDGALYEVCKNENRVKL